MQATEETSLRTPGDEIAERILAAFDGHDGYLNGRDLVEAAGVGREQYLEVLSNLIEETGEIVEVEADSDDEEMLLYARPKPRRQAE